MRKYILATYKKKYTVWLILFQGCKAGFILKNESGSSQDGGIGKHSSPPHTTTAKITTKFQNNYHPELSDNWAKRKFNNQGIKRSHI